MKKTGFLYDKRFLLHDTGPYHPETAARLEAIMQGIKSGGLLEKLISVSAKPADLKWIETIHEPDYIQKFKEVCLSGCREFESADNQICYDTYEAARLAAGGVLEAVDMIMEGKINNAFCAVRPPGHHAESGQSMGFCYFNNVAIAARFLQCKWDIKKILIIDFDVHHGNGTQHLFEEDPFVYYFSTHQHPSFAFPGTGREFEKGRLAGLGFTKNCPLLPGQGDKELKKIYKTELFPLFADFKPEFVFLSTGFDAHIDDVMSDLKFSSDCFEWIIKEIIKQANQYANGRIISVLEGGYSLERLPELAKTHVASLLDG